jgi:hypothetical protein
LVSQKHDEMLEIYLTNPNGWIPLAVGCVHVLGVKGARDREKEKKRKGECCAAGGKIQKMPILFYFETSLFKISHLLIVI